MRFFMRNAQLSGNEIAGDALANYITKAVGITAVIICSTRLPLPEPQ